MGIREVPLVSNGVVTLMVRIEETAGGECRISVARGKGQPLLAERPFPLSPERIAAWRQKPLSLVDPPKGADGVRILSLTGTMLFDFLFHGPTLDQLRAVQREAETGRKLLRIVLDLTAEWQYPLPWEALHDSQNHYFLMRQRQTVIVRWLPDGEAAPPPIALGPLRILAVIASPSDQQRLEVEQERVEMVTALTPLMSAGRVTIKWLERPPDQGMQEALVTRLQEAYAAEEPFTLLHYIGHARYNHGTQEGELLLEGADGRSAPLSGIRLGEVLQNTGVTLAFLNACEGAKGDQFPYRSIAAEAVQRGNLPLALANQMRVRNTTATRFSQAFYAALAERVTVEEAVMEARRAVARLSLDAPEWASNIFFTRYRYRAVRLFPTYSQRVRSLVILGTLLLLMLVVGVSTISLLRHFGLVAGLAMQAGFLSLIGAMGYLLADDIRRLFAPIAAVAAAATLLVFGWFLWQPVLRVAPPPPAFRLTIDSPSPYTMVASELPVTALTASVRGTVANLPPGHHLWILVRTEGASTYAAGEEATISDGHFVAPTVLVGPVSTRQMAFRPYRLQPVVVDEAGHRFLLDHGLQRWRLFHPDFVVSPAPLLQSALVLRR